ncbi:hypothetical protein F2Q70_00013540 [Brassica cretica]|uniref:Uncharacterized protein n=1 Tax=Brassica cretica TaxID=69181 RepID=A0A8S9M3Y3_BRACR|nr:hypothetical protein F2Q70_00013540 [Brassica cretica]
MPTRLQVNQPATPHDSKLMSLHTYLTGHGTMSQWGRLAFLSQPVHPQINQSRHLDPSSMDQVVHPCPRSDLTRPSLNKHTKLNTLDHVPSLIMDGHAPPGHTSIIVLSHTSSIDKIYSRVTPTSHPWNFHETSFHTASAFKAVHAIESGVQPSPIPPDHLRVFPGHIGSLGCDHP